MGARNLNRVGVPGSPDGISGDAHRSDTSDAALSALLHRIQETSDPDQLRQLSDELERLIFHKQFGNA